MSGRSLVDVEPVEDGFVMLCDCATRTHVVLEELPNAPAEFAVTCDGCLTSHWFTYQPGR